MREKVRIAIVGCGGIAGAHLNGYESLIRRGCDTFDIVATCDTNLPSAEAFAERIASFADRKPRAYSSLEEMLQNEQLDGADICTPHFAHHTTAIACLEAGVNVMVEKPIGITVKASRKIVETGQRTGKIVATAENVRRYLHARAMEWAINKAGMIGEPRMFFVQSLSFTPFPVDSPPMQWRALKLLTGGGMIMDSGAHFTDMMLHLFGDVDEVFCQMRTFDAPEVEAPIIGKARLDVEDSWIILFKFKSGLMGTWAWSRSAPGHTITEGIYYGSRGSMKDLGFVFHTFQSGAELKLADGTVKSREEIELEYLMQLDPEQRARLFPFGLTDGFAIEVWDFIDAIANGRRPDVDGTDGLRAKALCEACYESATIGAPVKFEDVVEGKIAVYQKPIDDYWKI